MMCLSPIPKLEAHQTQRRLWVIDVHESQKSTAVLKSLDLGAVLARLSVPITQMTAKIIEDMLGHWRPKLACGPRVCLCLLLLWNQAWTLRCVIIRNNAYEYDIICSSWACCTLPESWITKCCSKLIYELLPEKQVVYVLPITSILGRLPVVQAWDAGTIPFKYRTRCRNGAHRYDTTLARADTSPGAEDGCPMYFVNCWALGWSRNPWQWIKLSVCPEIACIIACYDTLC